MNPGFLEIFSKKNKLKSKIIIDYREKNSQLVSELSHSGIELEFRNLKVGDYLINNVAIERKTVQDFISSMKNKRLIKQLEEIQQYKERLLIIEGIDEQELYTDSENIVGIHPNAIRGFLLSIMIKHKVPIVFTKNYEDSAKFLLILSKKEIKESSLNVSKKNLDKKERMQFILESFSGIGPKTAKKLLEEFKTIKNIINTSEEELKRIIGKKAETFRVAYEKY